MDYGDWCVYMPTTGFRSDLERRSDWGRDVYALRRFRRRCSTRRKAARIFPALCPETKPLGKFIDLTKYPRTNMADSPNLQGRSMDTEGACHSGNRHRQIGPMDRWTRTRPGYNRGSNGYMVF